MKETVRLLSAALIISLNCLSINGFAQADAGVSSVLAPATGSTLVFGNSYTVQVRVQNYGTTTLTSIPLKFNVGNSTPLEETWAGSLAPGDSVDYTFTSQFVLTDTTISSAYCLADINPDAWPPNNAATPSYSFAGPGSPVGLQELRSEINIDHITVIHGQEMQLLISFQNSDQAKVSLVSIDGRTIESTIVAGAGSGQTSLSLPAARGIYFLIVESEYGRSTKKILF